MPLWITISASLVASLAIGVSGLVAYIVLSLTQAAPVVRSRTGIPAARRAIQFHKPLRVSLAASPARRRTLPQQRWINAH